MNFSDLMLPVKKESIFKLDGFHVWCGTMTKGDNGKYFLYFSFWDKNKGHNGWVTHSQVGFAISENPTGPYKFGGIALSGSGGDGWDRDVIHNPTVIKYKGVYYMYYMGNYGNGEYWDHRNHQRVGVAYAKMPEGPWYRFDYPIIDTTPDSHDSLMTSNPTVAVGEDGRIYMVYKAVSDKGVMPKGGAVVCGVAISDNPLGPYIKHPKAIMINPENDWSVEDPYIWFQDGKFYALVKDFQGYFSKTDGNDVVLFVSNDCLDWELDSEYPLAFRREIYWEDNILEKVHRLERPQLWLDKNGKPKVLFCACMPDEKTEECYNVHIPLKDKVNVNQY